MSAFWLARMVALASGLCIPLACGGQEDRANVERLARATEEQTREDESRDACSLITKEEAESILGNALDVRSSTERSFCEYASPAPTGRGFSIRVYWTDGKENLEATKSAMSIAPDIMEDNGMETIGMLTLKPVQDLGDEAYYNAIAGSYVRKGDALLEFDLRLLLGGDASSEQAIALWRALADRALARI